MRQLSHIEHIIPAHKHTHMDAKSEMITMVRSDRSQSQTHTHTTELASNIFLICAFPNEPNAEANVAGRSVGSVAEAHRRAVLPLLVASKRKKGRKIALKGCAFAETNASAGSAPVLRSLLCLKKVFFTASCSCFLAHQGSSLWGSGRNASRSLGAGIKKILKWHTLSGPRALLQPTVPRVHSGKASGKVKFRLERAEGVLHLKSFSSAIAPLPLQEKGRGKNDQSFSQLRQESHFIEVHETSARERYVPPWRSFCPFVSLPARLYLAFCNSISFDLRHLHLLSPARMLNHFPEVKGVHENRNTHTHKKRVDRRKHKSSPTRVRSDLVESRDRLAQQA